MSHEDVLLIVAAIREVAFWCGGIAGAVTAGILVREFRR